MTLTELVILAEIRAACADGTAKQAREDAHVSQAEIAAWCGVSAAAVSLWEGGRRVPRGRPALRYAAAVKRLRARAEAPR